MPVPVRSVAEMEKEQGRVESLRSQKQLEVGSAPLGGLILLTLVVLFLQAERNALVSRQHEEIQLRQQRATK
jgi:hypothetical protein